MKARIKILLALYFGIMFTILSIISIMYSSYILGVILRLLIFFSILMVILYCDKGCLSRER